MENKRIEINMEESDEDDDRNGIDLSKGDGRELSPT